MLSVSAYRILSRSCICHRCTAPFLPPRRHLPFLNHAVVVQLHSFHRCVTSPFSTMLTLYSSIPSTSASPPLSQPCCRCTAPFLPPLRDLPFLNHAVVVQLHSFHRCVTSPFSTILSVYSSIPSTAASPPLSQPCCRCTAPFLPPLRHLPFLNHAVFPL